MAITDPTDLPNLWLWLDASDAASITLTSGRVSQWSDKSGVGNHAVQATATSRPDVLTAELGGLDVVAFEQFPNAEWLRRTAANMAGGTALTVVILGMMQSGGGARALSLNQTGQQDWNNAASVALNSEGGDFPTGFRNSAQIANAGDFFGEPDGYFIYTWRFDGTDSFVYVNDTGFTPVASTGTFDIDQYTIAANTFNGETAYIRVAEIVACSTSLSLSGATGDLYDLWVYLDEKWTLGLGLDPGGGGDQTVNLDTGIISLSGQQPTLTGSGAASRAVDVGNVVITGVQATLTGSSPVVRTLDTGTIVLAGQDPTAGGSGAATVAVDPGALTLAGVQATLAPSGAAVVALDPGALTLLGVDVVASAGAIVVQLDTGILNLTGVQPTLAASSAAVVAVDPGLITLTGITPSIVGQDIVVALDTGVLSLTGVQPVLAGADAVVRTLDPGQLTLAGQQATLAPSSAAVVQLDSGLLVLTGQQPALAGAGAATVALDVGLLLLVGMQVSATIGALVFIGHARSTVGPRRGASSSVAVALGLTSSVAPRSTATSTVGP